MDASFANIFVFLASVMPRIYPSIQGPHLPTPHPKQEGEGTNILFQNKILSNLKTFDLSLVGALIPSVIFHLSSCNFHSATLPTK